MKRLHLPQAKSGLSELTGEPFHYLSRVLRVKAGDALEVFDGQGQVFAAQVKEVAEAALTLELKEPRPAPRAPALTLIQGLPKGDKLELVLQKGTELGVAAFYPVVTARAVSRPKDGEAKAERWRKIVSEAARQCGRADVPPVAAPGPLEAAVAALPQGTQLLVLDEEEHALRLSDALGDGPVALVVGPEGGLAREEVVALRQSGGVSVTLGPRVLRTETAALAALAVLLHRRGELG